MSENSSVSRQTCWGKVNLYMILTHKPLVFGQFTKLCSTIVIALSDVDLGVVQVALLFAKNL
jgi:hypothetical protein